ncbi:aspartate kinase [Paraliomyxa miuraensis]|uniref:aspartate kinase n=1 Tax=Paraliomyxa miuraensis TaxID=376150 RepID=UPI0022551A07|nr:aspartate kinase [Paraliomyxa miuraensis]MCX4246822.1 aspartate kinase [Paraliomyxa miuraensis]
MIVMKFGGSSVANREQITKVLGIVRDRLDRRPVVVSSAHKGITDALIDAARTAASGFEPGEAVIERQRTVAGELGCAPELLMPLYSDIRDLLRGIRLVGELSPRSLDHISSFGERMSVRCIADYFTRQGLAAQAFDAWDLGLHTDDNYGRARPVAEYAERMKAAFAEKVPPGVVPIVTGFVGKSARGVITTLGRNGSDLSATLVGAAIGADEVQIWSDTDGVMSADPSIVKAAKSIPTMRFDEAAELAFFGSRVLHPATLLPAIGANISVRVLNTNRPGHPGTVIESAPEPKSSPVTSIAYKEGQTVLVITEPRMFEQVGFLARFFEVLARHQVVVDLVATSEVSVSITTHDREALERSLPDLAPLGRVEVHGGKTILAVVGRHIQHTKGVGAKVLEAMSRADVNIQMHTFGMSSNNISLVIDDDAVGRAVATLHAALFED